MWSGTIKRILSWGVFSNKEIPHISQCASTLWHLWPQVSPVDLQFAYKGLLSLLAFLIRDQRDSWASVVSSCPIWFQSWYCLLETWKQMEAFLYCPLRSLMLVWELKWWSWRMRAASLTFCPIPVPSHYCSPSLLYNIEMSLSFTTPSSLERK